jgi:hypothetical protein
MITYKIEPKYFLEEAILYTGQIRLGYEVGKTKILDAYYAASSLHGSLKDPLVFRVGLEYRYNFF